MNFGDIVDIAFTQGVGMKREHVHTDVHFTHDLLPSIGDGRYATAAERAEMLYLGEKLADEAFKALPKKFQQKAQKWSVMTHEQRRIAVREILHELTSDRWVARRKLPRPSREKAACVSEVLPHAYKSWEEGEIQPNCLAIAQMLIGFGRATGSRVIMADTIRRYDRTFITDMYLSCAGVWQLLDTFSSMPHISRIRSKLERHMEEYAQDLEFFADYDQAHHAVMIESGKGVWFLVDPYMLQGYTYDDSDDELYEVLTDVRHCEQKKYQSYDLHASSNLQDACTMIDALMSMFQGHMAQPYQADDYDTVMKMIDIISKFAQQERETVRIFRSKLAPDTPLEYVSKKELKLQIIERVFGRLLTEDELSVVMNDADKVFDYLPAVFARNANKRARDRVIGRLTKEFLDEALTQLFEEYNPVKIHPSVELGHAEYHLATMTLNHLAVATGSLCPEIGFFNPLSQHIMRDVIAHEEVNASREIQSMIECSLHSFGELPRHAVAVDLLLRIDQIGESNG